MSITVDKVGYAEFKRLLSEKYGKDWRQWVSAVCPDGIINENKALQTDLDDAAKKLGWQRKKESP
jgi:hypothetical protein